MKTQFFFAALVLLSNKKLVSSSQELNCYQHVQKDLCPGNIVTATCSVQSPVVLWIIHTADSGSYEIDFNARDAVGNRETDGAFSANLTRHYPSPDNISESVLQYVYTNELNNTKLVCANLLNETLTQSCQIFSNELPGNVKNISNVQNTCQYTLISWNEPETTSTIVRHYMVVVESSTICNEINKCISPTTNFNLTKLNYGVNYTISVSACSCDGCGTDTLYHYTFDGLTKKELIEHLVIVGNISYNVQFKDVLGYEITLSWKEPVQSCINFYLVKIQNADKTSESLNITTNTSLTIPHRSQGTLIFVSVAGANGDIIGDSSSIQCIYIERPETVTNINGNITGQQGDANYYLLMDWAPPTNGTCTRPQVLYYEVSLSTSSKTIMPWSTTVNNTLKSLPTSLFSRKDTTVFVYVHAINSIGPGPIMSVSFQLPNKAIARTLSGFSISFMAAVFVCLLGTL